MIRTLLFATLLLPTLLWGAQGGAQRPRFNPSSIQIFKGEVSSTFTFSYVTSPTRHKQVLLHTSEGEIAIDLGPEWYLSSRGISLYTGETIEIEGSLIHSNGTPFVIASALTKGEAIYKLREKNGKPLWRGR